MDSREQIEKIYQCTIKRHIALTIGIPELYQKWIAKTFFKKVVSANSNCFTIFEPSDMMVFVNIDSISDAELYEIKQLQNDKNHQYSAAEFFYVNEKQLKYYYENSYWVMCSYWPCKDIDEAAYQEYLAYANLVLKEAGYHLFRDQYLFSYGVLNEYDVYVQSAIWQDDYGDYFIPIFHEGAFSKGSADIEIEALHDDIFLTEGFVSVNSPLCDIKREILALAT